MVRHWSIVLIYVYGYHISIIVLIYSTFKHSMFKGYVPRLLLSCFVVIWYHSILRISPRIISMVRGQPRYILYHSTLWITIQTPFLVSWPVPTKMGSLLTARYWPYPERLRLRVTGKPSWRLPHQNMPCNKGALQNIWNPFKLALKLNLNKLSFAHSWFLRCAIVWNGTTMSCETFKTTGQLKLMSCLSVLGWWWW